jgi:hypothetical protein
LAQFLSLNRWLPSHRRRVVLTSSLARAPVKVTFEDYPEAGMSALKYYTIQSYNK